MLKSFFEFIKKNKPWSWVFIGFLLVPIFIQVHLWPIFPVVRYLTPGNPDTWVQFWGSYLGIIPSGLIAWIVASKQIESSRENDRRNYIETLYLNDLRKIKDILLLHQFSGEWQFPYNGSVIGCYVSNEVSMFRKMFLKINGEGDKEEIRTDELFDIKTIVHGLPKSKRDIIQPVVDNMCSEILRIALIKPDRFKYMENQYMNLSYHKGDGDIQLEQFKSIEKTWKEESEILWKHIETITSEFNRLNKFVNDELAIYYKL